MSDNPNASKEVKLDTAEIPQRKRMAAGEKCDGQHAPSKNQGVDKPVTQPNV